MAAAVPVDWSEADVSDAAAAKAKDFADKYAEALRQEHLTRQQQDFGQALRHVLPLWPNAQDTREPDLMLLPFIGAEVHKFIAAVTQYNGRTQANSIMAVARTSGSGKTKLPYALRHVGAAVVQVRLAYGEVLTKPFKLLVDTLENELEQLRAYGYKHGLSSSTDAAELIRHAVNLRKSASAALDFVRVYLFAHVEWLVLVDKHLRTAVVDAGFDWDVAQQRRAWLQALGNGLGADGVHEILLKRFAQIIHAWESSEIADNRAYGVVQRELGESYEFYTLCKLKECRMPELKDSTDSEKIIVFAIDEVGHAHRRALGMFHHDRDVEHLKCDELGANIDRTRLDEVFKGVPLSRQDVDRSTDIYHGMLMALRSLWSKHGIQTILMDTSTSLFEWAAQSKKSPAQGYMSIYHQYFHKFEVDDMLKVVDGEGQDNMLGSLYGETAADANVADSEAGAGVASSVQMNSAANVSELAPLRLALAVYCGRASFFCNNVWTCFLTKCRKEKPSNADDVARLLFQAATDSCDKANAATARLVRLKWLKDSPVAPHRRETVQQIMKEVAGKLLSDAAYDGTWICNDAEEAHELESCGIAFEVIIGSSESQQYSVKLFEEPLIFQALLTQARSSLNLRSASLVPTRTIDFIWDTLVADWQRTDQQMGAHVERMLAWRLLRAVMCLHAGDVCQPFFKLVDVLRGSKLLPDGLFFEPDGRLATSVHVSAQLRASSSPDLRGSDMAAPGDGKRREYPCARDGALSPPDHLQCALATAARPDLMLPLHIEVDDQLTPGTLSLQVKTTGTELLEALRSLDPGGVYMRKKLDHLRVPKSEPLRKDAQSLKEMSELLSATENKRKQRDEFTANARPLQRFWLRAVCRARRYPRNIIDAINEYNAEVEADPERWDYILLLHMDIPGFEDSGTTSAQVDLSSANLQIFDFDQRDRALERLRQHVQACNSGVEEVAHVEQPVQPDDSGPIAHFEPMQPDEQVAHAEPASVLPPEQQPAPHAEPQQPERVELEPAQPVQLVERVLPNELATRNDGEQRPAIGLRSASALVGRIVLLAAFSFMERYLSAQRGAK